MSSMKRVIESSGGFWRETTPLLPTYVRQINLGSYDRTHAPLSSETDRSRHYLINDVAFSMTAAIVGGSSPNLDDVAQQVAAKWRVRIGVSPLTDDTFDELERVEVKRLTDRLRLMIDKHCGEISAMPVTLPGVGLLETIDVDVIAKEGLAEVKAGERSFRSIDFRQLLLACIALGDRAAGACLILLNPREGICWKEDATSFVEVISLVSYPEFVSRSRFYLSEAGTSA